MQIVPDEDTTTSTVIPTLPDLEEAPRALLSSISVASFKHENIPPIVNTKGNQVNKVHVHVCNHICACV